MSIPCNDLKRGFLLHQAEYEQKALEVLRSGWYVLGNEVVKFEEEFSRILGCKYCIGVDNGLNAIFLGIKALGIGEGDEVIVQANTYIATLLGVSMNGALPVLVEPNEFFNFDTNKIEEKITAKTKAILVTHLYGQASKMDDVIALCKKYNLFLIEDCAQSHLAEYNGVQTGTFGDLGFFSFYPTKNLGGFGDGGAVVTNDPVLEQRLRILRNYGSEKKYHNEVLGYNSRLDEMQAGLLRVKLTHLVELTLERAEIAKRYLTRIKNDLVLLPGIEENATHVWHLFVVRVNNRDQFKKYMEENDIKTDIHYPIPPHLSKAYNYLGFKEGDFPITEKYAKTVVSIPMFNGMTNDEIETVIKVINAYRE
jgi:dTDP-4-amino-4,6-dideoxygalactose transaminase